MPQHLTDMDITHVSLVDKGANARRFALLKRQPMVSLPDALEATETDANIEVDHGADSGVRGALAKIGQALGFDVTKAEDFDAITAEREMSKAVDEGFDTLRSAVISASYGRDADGNQLPADDRRAMVGASIDQFKAFMLDAMSVSKAGRKISGARMTQLKDAFKVLADIINGVEQGYWTPDDSSIEKGIDEMTETELRELVDKRVGDSVTAAFAEDGAITKAIAAALAPKAEQPAAVEKTADATVTMKLDDDIVKAIGGVDAKLDEVSTTNGQVIEAVAKLADRVEALEAGRRQSSAGEAAVVTKAATTGKLSALSGILG